MTERGGGVLLHNTGVLLHNTVFVRIGSLSLSVLVVCLCPYW